MIVQLFFLTICYASVINVFFFLILSLCNNDIIIVFLKPIPMCDLILFQDICVSDCIYFIFHFDQH
jgi:hypothetical protein